jgi:glycerol kinase
LEATVNGAGAALEWIQKRFAIKEIHSLDWAAIDNPPVIINTIGGLGSPWWVADINSQIDCTAMDAATCVAAVMESIVFMLTANLRELQSAGHPIQEIKLGGGLSRSDGLCQRLANLTGLRVRRSIETEITALGTARLLAGEGCHFESPAMDDFEEEKDHALEARFEESMRLISKIIEKHKN